MDIQRRLEELNQLSPAKRALLLRALRDEAVQQEQAQEIPQRSPDAALPLSFAQERLWFMDRVRTGSPFYNIPAAVRLRGDLDVAALHASLNAVVARHEALRTTFATENGQPFQQIAPELHIALPTHDLADHAPDAIEQAVQQYAEHEAQQPFDLQHGPLVRATLLRLADDAHVLLLTLHHIVSDGWSMGVLVRDLAAFYQAALLGQPATLTPLSIQYADYAIWQRQWLQGPLLEQQRAYWRTQLTDPPPLPTLPTDHPQPTVQTFRGAKMPVELPAALSAALQQLSQRESATLFMTLLTAFAALLQRYSGQDDLLIGAPIANRTRTQTEPLIGFFVNTLALRTDLSGDPTFAEALSRARTTVLGAQANQDVPFEQLVVEVAPRRTKAGQSLFNTVLILQNTPMPTIELPSVRIEPLEIDNGTAKGDLTLALWEIGDSLRGWIEYSTELFEPPTIARMIDHFQTLLAAVVADPTQRIAVIPLRGLIGIERGPERARAVGGAELNAAEISVELSMVQPEVAGADPSHAAPSTPYVAPRNRIESALAQIWGDLLKIERVGVYDNFFELGGHSLLATQTISRALEAFQPALPERVFELEGLLVSTLFDEPTIAALARQIEEAHLGSSEPQAPPLRPMPRAERTAVSFAQERLWFLDQLQPGSAFYNIPAAMRLDGDLDITALHASLNAVVTRHEALRTTFALSDGQPFQQIAPELHIALPTHDLVDLTPSAAEQALRQYAQHEAEQPFDLEHGPLVRATLLRLADDAHVLLLTLHHIVSDGWSMGVLVRDLATFYQAALLGQPATLAPLPIQYPDYAIWQRQWLQGQVYDYHLSYWKQHLADAPPLLDMPTDRPRQAVQSSDGAKTPVELPAALSIALQQLSQRESATLFMTLLTAFATLLQRYSGQDDLVIGAPIANRTRAETEALIGFFVNTLALRIRLHDRPSFRDQLQRVREVTLGAYAHQDLPFESLVAEIAPPRDLSYHPLFQVMFILQNTPVASIESPGLTLTPLHSDNSTAKFDLTLDLRETPEGIRGSLEYSTALFDAATIARMVDHFETLLTAIVADPAQSIATLPLLSGSQREQLATAWNDTARPYPDQRALHQLFEEQVARTPDGVAVLDEQRSLSYAQLNQAANQLAHELQQRCGGALDETCVGVLLPRSLDFAVAVLAVLKAGGVYLPLDPAYPVERLQFMLHDSRAGLLLTNEHLQAMLLSDDRPIICVDRDWPLISRQPSANLPSSATPDSAAYLIYTSGSTGRPKGVLGLHRGMVNRLDWMWREYPFAPDEVCCQKTAISFVDSITELFGPLLAGVPLALIDDERAKDPPQLVDALAQHAVTRIVLVPSLLQALLERGDLAERLPRLALWVTSGEALSTELWQQFQALMPGRTLLNLYGSSEVSGDATACDTSALPADSEVVPIGRPIANTQVYILDSADEPTPVGVPGEILVGGLNVARGYLDQPALTAERFVPDPFASTAGARLYRTGDRGRYRRDNTIEYLGRIDGQIKIRGMRVEPNEVAAALLEHPAIDQAAVVACAGRHDDMQLVAFVVAAALPPVHELRAFLQRKLPSVMLPAAFVELPALPLTPNGKLDRQALVRRAATLEEQPGRDTFVAARNPTETTVAAVWAEVLRRERVGVYDNFFELGGHSLLATQAMSRVRNAFEIELPLRTLFEAPTVAALSERIAAAQQTRTTAAPPLRAVSHDRELPLSFAQQRLWFLHQLEPTSPAYNMPIAVRLCGALDVAALDHSLNAVVARHEALRTTFSVVERQPVQRITAALTLTIPLVSLHDLPPDEREQELERRTHAEAQQPFDLERGPLLRGNLFRLAPDEHVLLLNMHHIISDGWSLGVFVQELAQLYPALAAGQPSPLAPLPIQYADYAVWQREWLQGDVLQAHLSYWREQLADLPPPLNLPAARPAQALETTAGGKHQLSLPATLTGDLKALAQRESATLFMTLLAAFQTLLHRYSGQDDLVIGAPIANRNRAEIEPLIGFFLNMLALRTDLSGDPTFRELLQRVRSVTIGAQDHQDLPFEQIVAELAPARAQRGASLVQVMFMLRNMPTVAVDLAGLTMHPIEIENGTTKFDLSLVLWETPQPEGSQIQGWLEYSTAQFEPTTVARLAEDFQTLLSAAVADPDQPIATLLPLTEQLRQRWRSDTFTADYSELPSEPEAVATIAPRTETERTIAAVWQAALHLETIGVEDNFFDVGGHSLLMAQVHSGLEEALRIEIPITDLFEYPTISALAEYISRATPATTAPAAAPQIEQQAETRRSARQRRRELRTQQTTDKE